MQIKTYEELMEQALSLVDDNLDKREGSLIYTALGPVCALLAQCYTELSAYYDLIFADTAQGEYLDRIAAQFGLARKAATSCVKLAVFTFTDEAVDLTGQRFLCGGYAFEAEQAADETVYRLTAEEAGTGANTVSGSLTACEYIPGLASASITETAAYGTDAESDENLRARLLTYVTDPAFGGNQADYRNAALSVSGIGFAQIFTADSLGVGQVGIVVGDVTGKPVSDTLLEQVQSLFGSDASGNSLAPIGHTVTVNNCCEVSVPVAVEVTIRSDTTLDAVTPQIQTAVTQLLAAYDFYAASVSKARVISAILNVSGVEDVTQVTLGDGEGNLLLSKTIDCYQVPVVGDITVTEV